MGKGRAPCCDKSQVKRGPWSPAEDLKLIAFVQKFGHENWRALPKQAGMYICIYRYNNCIISISLSLFVSIFISCFNHVLYI